VDVVDHRDDRPARGQPDQHPVEAVRRRGQRRRLTGGRGRPEHRAGELARAVEELVTLGPVQLRERRVEELADEAPRQVTFDGAASGPPDLCPPGRAELRRLVEQPRLADPGGTGDEQRRALPRARGRKRLANRRELALALEQRWVLGYGLISSITS
jgi:hypothetical protein